VDGGDQQIRLLVNTCWFSFRQQLLHSGKNPELPDNLPATVIAQVQNLYSDLIKAPVSQVADQARGVICFCRWSPGGEGNGGGKMEEMEAESKFVKTRGRKSKAKVPRPPNAWILYRQHQHPLIKAQYPGIANTDICKSVLFIEDPFH